MNKMRQLINFLHGEGVMKAVFNLLLVVFLLIFIPSGFLFAGDDHKTSEIFDLGDVLVIGKSGDIREVTTTNTVSIEDIEKLGAANIAQALEQVPGIDIENHPKGGPTLKMRGLDQNNIKILIDGVPAHETYFGSLDLGSIPVDTIAKIEVVKGASSVLYGANTLGGVINIITKKGSKDFFTKVTTSFGKHNTKNLIFNHGGAKGNFNYWLTFSSRKSDGIELSGDFNPNNPISGIGTYYNEDGGLRDLSYYDNKTFNTKIGYDFDDDSKVYLSFDYHNNKRGCPTFGQRYWEYDHWKQWHVNLVGEHDISDKITIKGRLFYVDHEDGLTDVSWDSAHTTIGKKWFQKSFYDDYSKGGDFQAYINLNEKDLLKLGITYIKDHHTQRDFYDADCFPVKKHWASAGYQPWEIYEADTYSFAIENELKLLNDKLTLVGGVSYDINNPKQANNQPVPDKMDTINPQIGMVYNIDKTFSAHASVGKKTQFPQLSELYSKMAGGNPNLKPQEVIACEIGMAKDFTSDLNCSFAVFYNDFENKIVRERIAGDSVYVNKGKGFSKGFEAELDYTTPIDLEIRANYTFLLAEDKADSSAPWLESDHTPTHKYTMDFRYMFDFGLSTSFQWIYTGTQVEYDNKVKNRINAFTVYNARFAQQLTMPGRIVPELFLEIKNITDKNYEEGEGPTAGRSILFGVSVTF